LWQSSVEIVEQQQPIIVEKLEIREDSGGAGEWEGAPGAECILRPRAAPVRFMINSASRRYPPQGVRGGLSGAPMAIAKLDSEGRREELPITVDVTLEPGESLLSEGCGGGGFGDPLRRDPERVRLGMREDRISLARACDVYGVVLRAQGAERVVDIEATRQRRAELRREGKAA
jgi:N-methylhydantoinase B